MTKLFSAERTLEALVTLRTNADFNVVIADLALYAEERNKQLIFSRDPAQLASLQGHVRALVEVLEGIHDAAENLEKTRVGKKDART